jgi:hypothetical protein
VYPRNSEIKCACLRPESSTNGGNRSYDSKHVIDRKAENPDETAGSVEFSSFTYQAAAVTVLVFELALLGTKRPRAAGRLGWIRI